MLRRFRNYFLSGTIVVVPIGLTIWIIWKIFSIFDTWFHNILIHYGLQESIKQGGWWIPQYGLGFMLTLSIIAMLGFTTQLYIGRKMFDLVELLFLRIPVISNIYKAIKQVSEALMGKRKRIFEQVVIIEYPRRGIYSLAFITAQDHGRMNPIINKKLIYLFVPTTPNPTSGYFLMMPEDDCIPINISVEDAMKMIISSGMVAPPLPIKTEELDASPPRPIENESTMFKDV